MKMLKRLERVLTNPCLFRHKTSRGFEVCKRESTHELELLWIKDRQVSYHFGCQEHMMNFIHYRPHLKQYVEIRYSGPIREQP